MDNHISFAYIIPSEGEKLCRVLFIYLFETEMVLQWGVFLWI